MNIKNKNYKGKSKEEQNKEGRIIRKSKTKGRTEQ
jgi:hypothetical protein